MDDLGFDYSAAGRVEQGLVALAWLLILASCVGFWFGVVLLAQWIVGVAA